MTEQLEKMRKDLLLEYERQISAANNAQSLFAGCNLTCEKKKKKHADETRKVLDAAEKEGRLLKLGMFIGEQVCEKKTGVRIDPETAQTVGSEDKNAFGKRLMEMSGQWKVGSDNKRALVDMTHEAFRQLLIINMPGAPSEDKKAVNIAQTVWGLEYCKLKGGSGLGRMGEDLRASVAEDEEERNQNTKIPTEFWFEMFKWGGIFNPSDKIVFNPENSRGEDPFIEGEKDAFFGDDSEFVDCAQFEYLELGYDSMTEHTQVFKFQLFADFLHRLENAGIDSLEQNGLMLFYAIFFVGRKPFGADEWLANEEFVKKLGGAKKAKIALNIVKQFQFNTQEMGTEYEPRKVSLDQYKKWFIWDWRRLVSILKFNFTDILIMDSSSSSKTEKEEKEEPESEDLPRKAATEISEQLRPYQASPISSSPLATSRSELVEFTAKSIGAPHHVAKHYIASSFIGFEESTSPELSSEQISILMGQFNGATSIGVPLGEMIEDLSLRINNTISDEEEQLVSTGDKVSAFVASRLGEGYKKEAFEKKFGKGHSKSTYDAFNTPALHWKKHHVAQAIATVMSIIPDVK